MLEAGNEIDLMKTLPPIRRLAPDLALRFARSTSGNTAMIFGILAIALMSAAGAGVDFTRAMVAKGRLAAALDAAGLAVATTNGLSQAEVEELAQTYFEANYPADAIGTHGQVNVEISGDVISMSVDGAVPTTLLGVAGIESMALHVANEVTRGGPKLEVVMVLDNTGSMSGSKISSLKSAASTLVDTLSSGNASPERLKIALVPFAQTVRLNPNDAIASGWIDIDCSSSVAQLNFNNNMCAHTVLATMNSSTKWKGCVEARPNGYAVTDDPPTGGNPDTLWVPYFQPDEPDTNDSGIDDDYTDHYLNDGTNTNNELTRLRRSAKYAGKSANNQVNRYCNMPEILPLTNNMNAVENSINAMQADGYTHIPFGAVWGWRVLSPGEPFTQGAAYDDDEFEKVMILMTDGENTVPPQSTMNGSMYTAFGYLRQGRLGTTSSIWSAQNELDEMLIEVCDSVKAQGIRIYTIGFQISTNNVLELLEDCATTPSMFYNSPSTGSLQTAFNSIATELANMHLSK